jgi:hypothetical protein
MRWLLLTVALVSPFAGCEGSVGDDCDEEGKVDGECEDNAVCGKSKNDALVCLKQCLTQADCAQTEDCNGVAGSNIKGCRPR